MRVTVEFHWSEVGQVRLDRDGKLSFPEVADAAGIYSFLLDRGQTSSRYVGETDNLKRRFMPYRNPGPKQATNIRLNGCMKSVLASRGLVGVFTVTEAAMESDGKREQMKLSQKPHRALLEGAALVVTIATPTGPVEKL